MSTRLAVPMVVRGTVVEADEVTFRARRNLTFSCPDATLRLGDLCLPSRRLLAGLHSIPIAQIVELLSELGQRLDPERNRHMRAAYEAACLTSGLAPSVLYAQFEQIPAMFQADTLLELIERSIGRTCLDGWVNAAAAPGAASRTRVRAFGARTVHVIAGNAPQIAATSIIRSAVTRSDCIIKVPSNDLLTAVAIARTLVEIAPSHPLTRHLSVAYWKGGDARVERFLYSPDCIEKLIAWGGQASISHVMQHLRPGVELICFEPKLSSALIDGSALAGDAALPDVAGRLARDVGILNQEACFSVRTAFVVCDGRRSRSLLERLAAATLDAIKRLPECYSAPMPLNVDLQAEVEGLRMTTTDCVLYGDADGTGTVILSLDEQPVDFARQLAGRIVNLVAVPSVDAAMAFLGAHAQTVAVYPESLKARLRDPLAHRSVQRIVSLGHSGSMAGGAGPQDGMEPLRRMCSWVVEEVPV